MESYSLVLRRLGVANAHRWLEEIERGTGSLVPIVADLEAAGDRVRSFPDQAITLFDAVLAELADRLTKRGGSRTISKCLAAGVAGLFMLPAIIGYHAPIVRLAWSGLLGRLDSIDNALLSIPGT